MSATSGLPPLALALIFFGALFSAISSCCCLWYLCCLRPAARRREAEVRVLADARLKASSLYRSTGDKRGAAGLGAVIGLPDGRCG